MGAMHCSLYLRVAFEGTKYFICCLVGKRSHLLFLTRKTVDLQQMHLDIRNHAENLDGW